MRAGAGGRGAPVYSQGKSPCRGSRRRFAILEAQKEETPVQTKCNSLLVARARRPSGRPFAVFQGVPAACKRSPSNNATKQPGFRNGRDSRGRDRGVRRECGHEGG